MAVSSCLADFLCVHWFSRRSVLSVLCLDCLVSCGRSPGDWTRTSSILGKDSHHYISASQMFCRGRRIHWLSLTSFTFSLAWVVYQQHIVGPCFSWTLLINLFTSFVFHVIMCLDLILPAHAALFSACFSFRWFDHPSNILFCSFITQMLHFTFQGLVWQVCYPPGHTPTAVPAAQHIYVCHCVATTKDWTSLLEWVLFKYLGVNIVFFQHYTLTCCQLSI